MQHCTSAVGAIAACRRLQAAAAEGLHGNIAVKTGFRIACTKQHLALTIGLKVCAAPE